MSEQKKQTEKKGGSNVLSAIPDNTPRVAIGFAVVFFVLVSLYPVVRNEVEMYLTFRQAEEMQLLELKKQSIALDSASRDKNLQALTSVVTSQGAQIMQLSKTVGELQGELRGVSFRLTECEEKLRNCQEVER